MRREAVLPLEYPSSTCEHGRALILRDLDGDGEYDTMFRTYCDGSWTSRRMSFVGASQPFPEGMLVREISGDFVESFVIELYTEEGETETTLGYFVKEPGNDEITFYYDGFYIK